MFELSPIHQLDQPNSAVNSVLPVIPDGMRTSRAERPRSGDMSDVRSRKELRDPFEASRRLFLWRLVLQLVTRSRRLLGGCCFLAEIGKHPLVVRRKLARTIQALGDFQRFCVPVKFAC